MNRANVSKIRRLISQVNAIQEDIMQNVMGMRYMCFSVEVDVTKPILASFLYKVGLKVTWIQFSYERMIDICYRCRLL